MVVEIYLVFVVILIILAVIDLTVGVANDAINFLNGAIGSNAGSMKTILIFASIGILVGVTFSAGMMEVARKGVFNPSFFTLPELLASTSLGHIVGSGAILGFAYLGLLS